MPQIPESILALDVGGKRVGLAVASLVARLPRPLATLERDDSFWDKLAEIITAENVTALVVGLPRNLSGQTTGQTTETEAFAAELKQKTALPVDLQDEAVTSAQAEAELAARPQPYKKSDIDSLAAVYILEDWLTGRRP